LLNDVIVVFNFSAFIPKFIGSLYKCKNVTAVAAEQVFLHWRPD